VPKRNPRWISVQKRVYHYKLYYYDLAGNLIRTVPPEGVNPLPDIDLPKVDKARRFDSVACNYNGPSVNSDKVTAFQALSGTLANSGNSAVEMWLYQTGESGKQLIATTPDMKYMFQTCINNNLLSIDVYSLQQDDSASVSIIHSNHVTTNIPTLLYDVPWTHVVVQGTNLASGALEVWINGKLYPAVEGSGTAGCDWTISSLPVLQPMPENIASLKHLRLYGGRLMTANEIMANAESGCFYISDTNNSDNFRFNVPDPGGVTLAEDSSVETQFNPVYPLHGLTTTYAYNSTNQVIRQASPDGGTSRFWYDNLSRLIISQNAKQAPDGKYSYTDYDPLGRITEVGEKTVSDITLTRQSNPEYLRNSFYRDFLSRGSDAQLTQTIYDVSATGPGIDTSVVQNNLRKRVAASVYRPTRTSADINASYYDYDLSGNVKTLYQQLAGLDSTRRLSYEYDLVSGKVNLLAYQHGKRDRFYYRYIYDAENRLTEAYSSDSANVDPHSFRSTLFNGHERLDAKYQYYLHGPLARMELGRDEQKVQGLDYVYTLQGWLKGVNGNKLSGSGGDVGDDKATVAKDALAYSLGYYSGDYAPIGGSGYSAFGMNYQPAENDESGSGLYNGNISNSTYAIAEVENGNTVGYTYKYDQLNRLKKLRQHNLSSVTGTWNTGHMNNGHYSEDFDYDGNGNILALKRNAAGTTMDQLSYAYNRDGNSKLLNNQLSRLTDNADGNTATELKDTTQYRYDAIGNLISDSKEGITGIDWTVYGKIGQINKTDSAEKIVYSYDPTGNRVSKTSNEVTTWYVRDAQGNSLAVYDNKSGGVNWREQQLYGSSRLGMWRPNFNLATDSIRFKWNSTGLKFFELNNHLGNVMSVINDNRTGSAGDYAPVVINAQDYYAFGSVMPGREYALNTTSAYRYGFNGKENDNEVKKDANGNDIIGAQQDYGMRIYDPRIGRFLSVDPITSDYPMLTPYQFASNRPIDGIDREGLEFVKYRPWLQGSDQAGPVLAVFVNLTANTVIGSVNAVAGTVTGAKDVSVYLYKVATKQRNIGYDLRTGINGVSSSVSEFLSKPIGEQAQIMGDALTSPEAYGNAVGFFSMGGGKAFFRGAGAAEAAASLESSFAKGGTKLMSSEMLNAYPESATFGPINTFIAPTNEVNALLLQGLSRSEIATKLGITDPKFLKGDLIRIDVTPDALKKMELKSPTGSEAGANDMYVKGGKTVGGVTEGVVSSIPKSAKGVKLSVVKDN
jgi:RHS repeat-associated protein